MPALKKIRPFIHYGSYALVLLALVYLGNLVYGQMDRLTSFWPNHNFAIAFAIACFVYLTGIFCIALGWASMATMQSNSIHETMVAYAQSSILKYLPGNFVHFIGRNVASKNKVKNHWQMGSATIVEILYSLASAIIICGVVVQFQDYPTLHKLKYILGSFALICLIFVLILPKLLDSLAKRWPNTVTDIRLPKNLTFGFFIIATGFICLAASAGVFVTYMWGDQFHPSLAMVAFLLSWLAGFMVPGAPGGIGVREAVLTAIISAYVPVSMAIIFAVSMRLVSILADLILFLYGLIYRKMALSD